MPKNEIANNDDDFITDEDIHIELTPLIDVIFMLIIFFILTTSFIVPSLNIDLPNSESALAQKSEKTIDISISKDGLYFYKNNQITISEINILLKNNEDKLNIFPDKQAPIEKLINLIDLAQKYKNGHFIISTNHANQANNE
ncbi:MAG: ExbD/TolR family protein [Succinivibrionaceae bacterium]